MPLKRISCPHLSPFQFFCRFLSSMRWESRLSFVFLLLWCAYHRPTTWSQSTSSWTCKFYACPPFLLPAMSWFCWIFLHSNKADMEINARRWGSKHEFLGEKPWGRQTCILFSTPSHVWFLTCGVPNNPLASLSKISSPNSACHRTPGAGRFPLADICLAHLHSIWLVLSEKAAEKTRNEGPSPVVTWTRYTGPRQKYILTFAFSLCKLQPPWI